MQKRQTFSKEFKLEAVRLLEVTNKPIADLARELERVKEERDILKKAALYFARETE